MSSDNRCHSLLFRCGTNMYVVCTLFRAEFLVDAQPFVFPRHLARSTMIQVEVYGYDNPREECTTRSSRS